MYAQLIYVTEEFDEPGFQGDKCTSLGFNYLHHQGRIIPRPDQTMSPPLPQNSNKLPYGSFVPQG